MTRKLPGALGTIHTPHGEVIVRKYWKSLRSTFSFQFSGHHLALRWMLPNWTPTTAANKTQVTPPTPIATTEEVDALFSKMKLAWQQRLQAQGVPAPVMLPSGVPAPYQNLAQLRELVDAEIASSLRPSTVATYRYQWNGILAKIPDTTPVTSVDRTMIQEAIADMTNDGLAAATVRRNVEALGRLLARAVEDGVLPMNPVAKVRLPKSAKRVPRFLTAEQRRTLLSKARDHGRDAYLLIALAVFLGLRKAELGALRWEDVDLKQKVATVANQDTFTTKNRKNRAVPICDELAEILGGYVRPNGYVLKPRLAVKKGKRYRWEFKKLFDGLLIDAGLPDWVTPHVLRHTFASLAAQAGVSLFKIGAWMGHSMTEVTEIYAHLAAYDADINKMVEDDRSPGPVPALKLVK